MAYEKYTWVDGEVITAQKLNHIEEGIAEGGDAGYECTETTEELFEETVTTVSSSSFIRAGLSYSSPINVDVLTVVFDGVEYTCPKQNPAEGVSVYGDVNFSQIPFYIASSSYGNTLYTENIGEYTIKAMVNTTTVTTSDCFASAVLSLVGSVPTGSPITIIPIVIDDASCSSTMRLTEIEEVVTRGDTIIPVCDDHDTRFTMTGVYAGTADNGNGGTSYEFVFFYPPNRATESGRDYSNLNIAFCSIGSPSELTLKHISLS